MKLLVTALVLITNGIFFNLYSAELKTLNDGNFYQTAKDKVIIVDFYADWCGPCREFAPTFKKVADRLSKYGFYKVDVDHSPTVSNDFKIEFIPFIAAVKNGKFLAQYQGNRTEEDFYNWSKTIFENSFSANSKTTTTTVISAESETESELPESITVYSNGNSVINWQPDPSYKPVELRIVNHYEGDDGVYVAVYTRNKAAGKYSVGSGIYVAGLIRLQGTWEGTIARPKGDEKADISALKKYKKMASDYFPECKKDAWVGGDTGGFFGK